jgi:hypothetical protein
MEHVRLLFLFLGLALTLCLFLGLYRPWWVLWWEDTQNRKKVITLYGTTASIFFFIYGLMGIWGNLS